MTAKTDVRTIKTRRSLIIALFALLERKPWAKVSIKDICKEAMVSRSTFYAHFEDKYALLEYTMKEMGEVVLRDLLETDMRTMLQKRFSQMKDNERIVKNMLLAEPEQDLLALIYRHFQNVTHRYLEEIGASVEEDVVRIAVGFYGAGVGSTIVGWFVNGQDIPVDTMVDLLCRVLEPAEQIFKKE
ncbi:MAG: TetR/AcrR family transcriptional regulator [Lachnospiraceae bacterium]|nr:TetR/AcrR family transcriptional regulator [Lachnospiraceae bacterium]